MEKLGIKRLESSSSSSSRDFETLGRSIRRFLKNSTSRSRFLKKLKRLKHKQGRFKHLKVGNHLLCSRNSFFKLGVQNPTRKFDEIGELSSDFLSLLVIRSDFYHLLTIELVSCWSSKSHHEPRTFYGVWLYALIYVS